MFFPHRQKLNKEGELMIIGKHRCPLCGNTTFVVRSHVVQAWKVEVTHAPSEDDIWTWANKSCYWSGEGSQALIH